MATPPPNFDWSKLFQGQYEDMEVFSRALRQKIEGAMCVPPLYLETTTSIRERKPTMNYSLAIFLISDEVRGINVSYEKRKTLEDEKEGAHLFKTLDPSLKVDDYVVVQTNTRHDMTVCKVVEVDIEPDFDKVGEVKWIIGRVERADFEALEAQEADAITKIKSAEKRKKRDELREALMKDAGEDLTALPIYTAQQEEKEEPAPDTDPDSPEDFPI